MVRICFDSKTTCEPPSSPDMLSQDAGEPSHGHARHERHHHSGSSVASWRGFRGSSTMTGAPAILSMSSHDFVLLDRLERRVDAQSFATVLKAYLVVKNRLAARRADREFRERRQGSGAGAEAGGVGSRNSRYKKINSRVALMDSNAERAEVAGSHIAKRPSVIRRLWSFKKTSSKGDSGGDAARGRALGNGAVSRPSESPTERAAAVRAQGDYPRSLAEWEAEETLLEQRLAFLGCRTVTAVGDGNCQFRSCAFGLFGSEDWHKVVRKKAVRHMRIHTQEYADFFEGPALEVYFKDMERSGTWGDELTLRAIADAFCCTIHLITSAPAGWYLRYDPEKEGEQVVPKRHLFLTYISPIHYNAFYLKNDLR
ncbi:uncharacterized protein LOC34623992 [Cyclospora cayetanensis]|uniref:Uncharacterized protein LOC34623992 n=1 Tax=Cyclospora cayetanensis TaxID=88456 RepID=A0A6P6S1W7_9EIME|nr:uncharacterized protein LOC34623992 [Cyclospora cayetanensis]